VSDIFVFICTRSSADFVVPSNAMSDADFRRKVHNAFQGLVGGRVTVGDLKLRPTQAAVADHLLCDGSTITREQFPLLVDYLAGAAATTAILPLYAGALTAPALTVTQTTSPSGTVSTGGAVTPSGTVGGTTGGNVVSGGRFKGELSKL
jgi:hypothetical protein